MTRLRERMIVIGVSAGGSSVLSSIVSFLATDFPAPVAIVQHVHKGADRYYIQQIVLNCALSVREACDKEPVLPGSVVFAPVDYHLLIEKDKMYSLSSDEPVNYARPSIDVLFESAALAFGPDVIGIVLSGANNDGSQGLKMIKDHGGVAIVQNPETAEMSAMPASAIAATKVDMILPAEEIGPHLVSIVKGGYSDARQAQHPVG